MNDHELEVLLKDCECDRVERKASASDREEIKKAICAFANDQPDHRKPGVLFIGAHDDGSCAKLSVTDEILTTIAGIRNEGTVLPTPSMRVQKRTIDGCEMVVVEVDPSAYPPVRYKGVTWVRTGPMKCRATVEEENRLTERRRYGNLPFDQRPIAGAGVADLDMELFKTAYLPSAVSKDVLQQNRRTDEEQLRSLRFLSADGLPTAAAILTIGRAPRQWVPGAYCQFIRFGGTVLTDAILDQREIDGPMPELFTTIYDVLKRNILSALELTEGPRHADRQDYPIEALRQLSANAIMHRNYESSHAPVKIFWFSDRVEIHNPGGPFGQVTRQNFGNPGVVDYRNPTLAEAMKVLGFVERFGVGIARARQALENNGNPKLEFQVEDTFVAAVVRKRP